MPIPRSQEPLIFEHGASGRRAVRFGLPKAVKRPVEFMRTTPPRLPQASELDVARHFTRLAQLNYCVDTHFYPLGSCTMKYNPKVNDAAASVPGFALLHPYQPEDDLQGLFQATWELEKCLCELTGMHAFAMQPAAGAHGELTGLLIVRDYFRSKQSHAVKLQNSAGLHKVGENNLTGVTRNKVLVPDSSHGTNPASAALAGFEVVSVKSNLDGMVDLDDLAKHLGPQVACLMLTNPNTLGLFEKDILEISRRVHDAGALLYYDGANMNALLGVCRPGDMGFDLVHINLHKTFSTPHGGGGPGAGPLGVQKHLAPFLPGPRIVKKGKKFALAAINKNSIGRVRAFYGSIPVIIRAYAYVKQLGLEGLSRVSRHAVLNANYLFTRLRTRFAPAVNPEEHPHAKRCMHEFVISARAQKERGCSALDIAKRLLDYGYHAPTIYFPLIVEEAMMVEPTETESKETLDKFARAILDIEDETVTQPELLKNAPQSTPVGRLDEVAAARDLVLRWKP